MADNDDDPADPDPVDDDLPLDPPADPMDDAPADPPADPTDDDPADPDPQDPPSPGEQRQPSRADRRIQTLTNELKETRQRSDDLNRRLDSLLAGQGRQQQGETPEQRAQRLALLTPEERIQETLRESEVNHAREMHTLRFAVLDGNDKAAFEAKCTVDPRYAKWKSKVETELAELRRNGQNVDREKLMYYLRGKADFELAAKELDRQRAAGQRRVNSQRTRPSNSGSDTSGNRRDRNASLERRLENQSI